MASEQRMKKQVTVVVASGQCQDTNNNKDPSHSLQRDLLPTAAAFTQSVGKLLFPPLPPLSHYFPHFLPIHPLSPSSLIPRFPPPLCVSCCKQFSTTSILVTLTNTRCLLNISSFINLLGSLSQHLLFLFLFLFLLLFPSSSRSQRSPVCVLAASCNKANGVGCQKPTNYIPERRCPTLSSWSSKSPSTFQGKDITASAMHHRRIFRRNVEAQVKIPGGS